VGPVALAQPACRSIILSTVRSVRSSSQSIRSWAKARLLRVAPELSDPVRLLEVGGHEEVGQLGAGSGTERVETRL
jgi:hypothetical protein